MEMDKEYFSRLLAKYRNSIRKGYWHLCIDSFDLDPISITSVLQNLLTL